MSGGGSSYEPRSTEQTFGSFRNPSSFNPGSLLGNIRNRFQSHSISEEPDNFNDDEFVTRI